MRLVKQLACCLIFGAVLGIIFYWIGVARAADNKRDYTPYKCDVFDVGDSALYKRNLFDKKPEFTGKVIRIDPKPTNEYIHLITLKDINGNSCTFSENLLVKLYSRVDGTYTVTGTAEKCKCEMPEVQTNLGTSTSTERLMACEMVGTETMHTIIYDMAKYYCVRCGAVLYRNPVGYYCKKCKTGWKISSEDAYTGTEWYDSPVFNRQSPLDKYFREQYSLPEIVFGLRSDGLVVWKEREDKP